ncbi:soluble lytic murein transglycosylase domain protein [Vibrio cholerae]|nr:soluble lytic murein transglycosylase domain protein [Vibrio cholerae]
MTRLTVFKPRSLVSILMFTTVWAVGSASASTLDLEAQRAQYDKAQRWLDEKNVAQYQRIRKQIDSYPLTPYLDYRAFLIDLGSKPPIAVRNFIDSHKEYPFSARIAAPYLDALARSKKMVGIAAISNSTAQWRNLPMPLLQRQTANRKA